MSSERYHLELTPTGLDLVRSLAREGETPEAVVRRALVLMQAVAEYMKDDALTVMDPDAPMDDDLVELQFHPSAH